MITSQDSKGVVLDPKGTPAKLTPEPQRENRKQNIALWEVYDTEAQFVRFGHGNKNHVTSYLVSFPKYLNSAFLISEFVILSEIRLPNSEPQIIITSSMKWT